MAPSFLKWYKEVQFKIMMMNRFLVIILLMFVVAADAVFAQRKSNYDNDIRTISAYEKMYQVPSHPIVFVGSSSIRKWDDLQEAFGSYQVINRGIGGSVIDDITYYAEPLIFRYKPRQIVLYVGDNDITHPNATADTIVSKTKTLYKLIRTKLPGVPIIYISIKPSPSREKYRDKIEEVNKQLKQFFADEANVKFVDVYSKMLAKDGSYRRDLFQPDMTHMLLPGYQIWEKAIGRFLIKP